MVTLSILSKRAWPGGVPSVVFLLALATLFTIPGAPAQDPPAAQTADSTGAGIWRIDVHDNRVSLDVRDADTAAVLRQLGVKAGIRLDVGPNVSGRITLALDHVPLDRAIRQICDSHALIHAYLPTQNAWRIVGAGAFGAGKPQAQVPPSPRAPSGQPRFPADPPAGHGTLPAGTSGDSAAAMAQPVDHRGRPLYKAGELLVRFKPGSSQDRINALHAAMGTTVIGPVGDTGIWKIKVRSGLSETQALQDYITSGIVEAAERHCLRYPNETRPDDPLFAEQWGLTKIRADRLWDAGRGDPRIIIAVIDTGIDYTHPELAGNRWQNSAEIAGNARDDDANGYTDDVFGYDFGDQDPDPFDSDGGGHGTHVAGIIAAAGNNGAGVAGLLWQCRLMALKAKADGETALEQAAVIEALDYARTNGARLVNCSYGGASYSQFEYNAIARLNAAGILAVCAAGNDARNNDIRPTYPAAYDLANIVSVAASTPSDTLAPFSNWGKNSVDLMAPGVGITSTLPVAAATQASVTALTAVYPAGGLEYAGLTQSQGITAALVDCGQGLYPDQFPAAVAGNIALIRRGEIYFAEKARNAQAAGAVAAVIYNNVDGPFTGTLISPGNWIPVVSVSMADGQALQSLGPVTVTVVNRLTGTVPLYGLLDGTSMAAPLVTGSAGLLLSLDPSLPAAALKAALLDGVDPIASVTDKILSGGRLNALKALCRLDSVAGDVSGDRRVALEDAVLGLRIMAGQQPTEPLCAAAGADAGGRSAIGLPECLFVLQHAAGLRE